MKKMKRLTQIMTYYVNKYIFNPTTTNNNYYYNTKEESGM